jgi:hypothetical protein
MVMVVLVVEVVDVDIGKDALIFIIITVMVLINLLRIMRNKKGIHSRDTKKIENIYYRCGMNGCWSRAYHTAKHLVDLYQSTLKGKEKDKNNFYSLTLR